MCRSRMTRRPGAQRQGKCLLRAELPECCVIVVGRKGRELTLPTLRVRNRNCMVKADLITPYDQTPWGAVEDDVLAKSCTITKSWKSCQSSVWTLNRPGAQRKGKCWLIAERILRVARVTVLLFTFCWHGKQGAYTSHAKSAQEKKRAYTPHANRAQSLLQAETAPANAARADVLGRMLSVVFCEHNLDSKC